MMMRTDRRHTQVAYAGIDKRAACGEEGSADSAKAQGPQVDSPAAAHQSQGATPRTDAEYAKPISLRDPQKLSRELERNRDAIVAELAATVETQREHQIETAKAYSELAEELVEEKKLSAACSRDCNATALERNALRGELAALRAPLPDVEAQVFSGLDIRYPQFGHQEAVPADYARALAAQLRRTQESYSSLSCRFTDMERRCLAAERDCKAERGNRDKTEVHNHFKKLRTRITELARRLAEAEVGLETMTDCAIRAQDAESAAVQRAEAAEQQLSNAQLAQEIAVHNERERCAAISESQSFPFGMDYMSAIEIAAAIRADGKGDK